MKVQTKNTDIFVGIDGYKGKWLAVAITPTGFEVDKYKNIEDVCQYYQQVESIIIIDVPIGLVENNIE